MTIARTETGLALNGARADVFEQDDVPFLSWSSANDPLVRPSHDIDGEKVRRGEKFSNGLLHAQEAGAPASEVVNCRCTTLAEFH